MFEKFLEKQKLINKSATLLRQEIWDNYNLVSHLDYELVDSFFFDENESLLFFIDINLSKEENKLIIEHGIYNVSDVRFLKSEKDCDIFIGLYSEMDEDYTYFICKKSGKYSIE
jgi:hypothetical protein